MAVAHADLADLLNTPGIRQDQIPPASGRRGLERARHCLRGMPAIKKADWPGMVRELGVSERTFRRKFKALTGMTPVDEHTRHRIEKARRLLLETNEKVLDVALSLHFVNEFYFSRRFKQFTGMSPRRYRELHRNR